MRYLMIRWAAWVLLGITVPTLGMELPQRISVEDLAAQLHGSDVEPLPSVYELPEEVRAVIADPNGRVADANEPFNSTDFVQELPSRRFIWSVKTQSLYVVHLEVWRER